MRGTNNSRLGHHGVPLDRVLGTRRVSLRGIVGLRRCLPITVFRGPRVYRPTSRPPRRGLDPVTRRRRHAHRTRRSIRRRVRICRRWYGACRCDAYRVRADVFLCNDDLDRTATGVQAWAGSRHIYDECARAGAEFDHHPRYGVRVSGCQACHGYKVK